MRSSAGMFRAFYATLKPYCENEEELKLVEACIEHGSTTLAAPHIGLHDRTVRKKLQKIKDRLSTPRNLIKDLDSPVASPLVIKGTSTLYDAETGQAKIAWVKTDADKEAQLKGVLDSFTHILSGYTPLKAVKAPTKTNKDILTVYPMGDPHIGMYAWASETGEDYDCDIAEKNLREAMTYLIDKAPPSETAIILNLGDFFHGDSSANTTTRGTNVDVDGRWARVLEIGVTLMIDCVYMALKKHKKVIVKNNIGNHDSHTSQVLSICMRHAFKGNKRVEIAEPANPFFVYEFGKCMIFSTHGDKVKPKTAQGIVSNYYPEVWGRTEHRLGLFGHFHHEFKEECNGLLVEIFNTLASSDAWHSASGYRSKRNMKLLVLDKDEGEIERYTFNLSRKMLEAHK